MQVLRQLPPGFFADSAWLKRQGVSRQLAHAYAQRCVLEHVAYGLYRRPEIANAPRPETDWIVPVLSAQWIMEYDLHVGATASLYISGHRHDLPMGGKENVHLYSKDMPPWIRRLDLRASLWLRNKRLFSDLDFGIETSDSARAVASFPDAGAWPLRMSTPERAILEAIDELPDDETFRALDMIFQGLGQLRPKGLRDLLECCQSVQVKRLFFVFADRHSHPWRKYLDPSDFDLGSGDRAFTRNGRLHPEYRTTVPAEFVEVDEGDASGA